MTELSESIELKNEPSDVAKDIDEIVSSSRSRGLGYIQGYVLTEKLVIYVSNQLRAAFDHGYRLGTQSNTASRLARTKANKTKTSKRKTKATKRMPKKPTV